MVHHGQTASPVRAELLEWTARIGAITANALAQRNGRSIASCRGQLSVAERGRLLSSQRLLAGYPALYTVTRRGLHEAGLEGIDPCRVSAANSRHLIVCAQVAAGLEQRYPDRRLVGERELRRDERRHGAALASAPVGIGPAGAPLLHRPDLVLWPEGPERGLPVAIEVELTIKAPRRLAEICRAWARCRCVSGVVYLATPQVARALGRAVEKAQAGERVVVVPLAALPFAQAAADGSIARSIPRLT